MSELSLPFLLSHGCEPQSSDLLQIALNIRKVLVLWNVKSRFLTKFRLIEVGLSEWASSGGAFVASRIQCTMISGTLKVVVHSSGVATCQIV